MGKSKYGIKDAAKDCDESSRRVSATWHQARIDAQKSGEIPSKGGCFIATVVYGDYDAPQVRILREFRDEVLSRSGSGRFLIDLYYWLNPSMADFVKKSKFLQVITRRILAPVVFFVKKR